MYEKFQTLLLKNNVTPYKVAKETGVTQTALSNWKTGRSTPTIKTLKKIADYFGVTVDYLMSDTGKGGLSVSSNIFPDENSDPQIAAGIEVQADFYLKVSGDSMINARILDGDIVFIKKQDIVKNGEIAAVIVNNDSEATLRRLYYYQNKSLLILRAENTAYEDQIYQNEELKQVRILGKAVAFQSGIR